MGKPPRKLEPPTMPSAPPTPRYNSEEDLKQQTATEGNYVFRTFSIRAVDLEKKSDEKQWFLV